MVRDRANLGEYQNLQNSLETLHICVLKLTQSYSFISLLLTELQNQMYIKLFVNKVNVW